MKKTAIPLIVALLSIGFGAVALASSLTINFETPSYVLGSPNGQDGWTKTGPYDAVISSSFGVPSFNNQSLRISNAVTSGSFGDQTFAKPLTDAAGEADSTDGSFSRGTLQNHFEAQFDIRPMQLSQQLGLAISVAPDRGDGSRMSYLRFEDQADGVHVFFDDAQGTTNPANFVESDIATLGRAVTHTIKFAIDFVNGPSNDVVKISIDGTLVKTGTTWENYYRYDSEQSAEQSPRIVKTLLFRTAGTAAPNTAGLGYLIDNLSLNSSHASSCTSPSAPQTQTYTAPGSYSFAVPATYCSLTVKEWGGGGGGSVFNIVGSSGGASSFASLVAAGGAAGSAGSAPSYSATAGTNGGSSSNGGSGGAGGLSGASGNPPGGGGGGGANAYGGVGGAYMTQTYPAGALTGSAAVTVGSGGVGGNYYSYYLGGNGARGGVTVTYTLAQ